VWLYFFWPLQRKSKPHANSPHLEYQEVFPPKLTKVVAMCRSPDSEFKPQEPRFRFRLWFRLWRLQLYFSRLWFVRRHRQENHRHHHHHFAFVALARVWLIKAQTLGIFNLYACKTKFTFFMLCFSAFCFVQLVSFWTLKWCVSLFWVISWGFGSDWGT